MANEATSADPSARVPILSWIIPAFRGQRESTRWSTRCRENIDLRSGNVRPHGFRAEQCAARRETMARPDRDNPS